MDDNLNSLESLKSHMLPTTFLRERSLTIGGGGAVLFQKPRPKNFSPSQVNSPKILPPPKMCAQKIVTLP